MPLCQLCGSCEFDVTDGAYFCTICQTQSQDIREEEHDDEDMEATGGRGGAFSLLIGAGKKLSRKTIDMGRPWMSYEAFQHIIQKQAKALIDLGADHRLEEIVWRIWKLFLASHKIAFCDAPVDPKTLTTRDRYALSMSGAREKLPTATKRSRTIPRIDQKQEQKEIEHLLKEAEFYEGDNPMEEELQDDDMNQSDEDTGNSSEDEVRSEGGTIITREKLVQKMSTVTRKQYLIISETPAFVLLGLRFTNPLVLPYDLIRWIREDKIPLKNSFECFPDDMKLSSFDRITFDLKKIPDALFITRFAAHLAARVGIDQLPPVDVLLVAHRFVIELGLPSELHGLLKNFFEHFPLSIPIDIRGVRKPRLCEPSVLAMACVVLMLKLLFVLDDKIETELSNYGRQLMKFLVLDQPLFIWDDWVVEMHKQFMEKSIVGESQISSDVKMIRNIDDYIARETVTKSKPRSIFNQIRVIHQRKSTTDALENVFRKMAQNINAKTFPDSNASNEENPTNADEFSELFSDEPTPAKTAGLHKFSTHSLVYITEDTFVDDCATQLMVGLRINDDEEEEEEEEEEIISPDGLERGEEREKKERYQALIDLASSRPRPLEHFVSYPWKPKQQVQKHSSYNWLIKVCASHIYCSQTTLDSMVQRLQIATLLNDSDLSPAELISKRQFRTKYFKPRVSMEDYYE